MKFIDTRTVTVFLFVLLFSSNVFSQIPVADFTVNDNDGCAPFTNATFTSISSGNPTSYEWDFGDGGLPITVNTPVVQHNYALPGVYTVTLTATNGSGPSVPEIKTDFITVFQNPQAKYTVDKDTICSGEQFNFTDTSIPGNAPIGLYSWSFQDGNPPQTGPGLSNVFHTYINLGNQVTSYSPLLLVNDTNGCSNSYDSITIYVKPAATANFGLGLGSSCSVPATIIFTNSSTGPSMYFWDFGDPASGANNTSTSATPSHDYIAGGSYLVTLTNGFFGCTVQDTMTINLAPPIAEFTVLDSIVCLNDSVLFTNTSLPTPLSSMTYLWSFGDLSPTSTLTNPTHAYINPGIYTVRLITRLGSCTSTITHTITVPNPPSISFSSPDRSACNVPFIATFNSDTTSLNVSWQWDFGDPASGASNTSTLRDPSHTYSNYGLYPIELIVTDVFGCQDSINVFNYNQVIQPVIDFTIQDSGCVGSIFNYDASVSSPADSIISDYTWDFGDGTPPESGTNASTTHQFNTVGIFDVTLTVTTQSGCTSTLTKSGYARVGTKPDAQIDSVVSSICFKGTVVFNDATPPPVTGWLWSFGDNQTSTDQNPSHKYEFDTSGVSDPYDIILIAYYNGCSDTDTVVNMVSVLAPIPLFDTVMNCLNPDSVNFINLSGGADSLFWDFGDGSPIDSISTNPYHIYNRGNYNVILTAKNIASGCIVDTTLVIQVREINSLAGSNITEVCSPGSISFFGSGSQDAVFWEWTFGEGIPNVSDTSYEPDTLHIYSRPGYYIATLTTTDINSCSKVDTQQVHIIGPTANFTADPLTGCSPITVTFKDSSQTEGGPIVNWNWDYGLGGPTENTTIDSIVHVYNNSGLYSVRLTVTDANGCTNMHTILNFINPTKPTAGIFMPDTVGCVNTSELIVGNAGPIGTFATPVTYNWNFGDGQSSSDTSNLTNHIYSANGNYTITLNLEDANGCHDTIQSNIFVKTTPAQFTITTNDTCVEIGGIKKALINATFRSDSNNLVTNWHWDLTVFDQPIWASPNFFYAYNVPPGAYDASLIVTNSYGCTDTSLKPGAIIVPGPTGSFTFTPDSGCSPLTVEFTGTSTNSQLFAWDFGDGTVLNGTTDSIVQHVYTAVNTYTPQFYLGFSLSNSFCYIPVPNAGDILVTSSLIVNIVEDSIVVNDGETGILHVILNDPNGVGPPYNYVWDPASNISNGSANGSFIVTPTDPVDYYDLSVPYGTQGCSGSDRVKVIYVPCDEINADTIPNVFTPNGDFINDTYFIKDLCPTDNFKIRIFNRWGKLVYESTDPGFRWDGNTTNGTEANEGVYYYLLNTKTKELHGFIELIRNVK